MSIIRAARPESNFTVVRNDVVSDMRMSLAAAGMLVWLLARHDGWKVSIKGFIDLWAGTPRAVGRDVLYRLLGEMEQCGYVERRQTRLENGRMSAAEYIVYDTPQNGTAPLTKNPYTENQEADSPCTEKPYTEKPYPVNPLQPNTKLTKDESKPITKQSSRGAKAKNQPSKPVVYPDWLDMSAWDRFVDMRKQMRKPLTDAGKALAIAKLEELRNAGNDPTKVLDRSTMNSWQGLFSLPPGEQTKPKPAAPAVKEARNAVGRI